MWIPVQLDRFYFLRITITEYSENVLLQTLGKNKQKKLHTAQKSRPNMYMIMLKNIQNMMMLRNIQNKSNLRMQTNTGVAMLLFEHYKLSMTIIQTVALKSSSVLGIL